ncbi:FecCD family ABC transporter permease [Gluconobacter cerinus]|uniref:FecCD family ABC transporter permease n=1 Tax=Gluconobacter cerinus TaxID=38307 RepID=UPI001B8CBEA3|nr:iron ABC transporter permease [Gluconobacter cerinus]MBS1042826.1 iron ABC transporter permease [Gluconobacter cerinus]
MKGRLIIIRPTYVRSLAGGALVLSIVLALCCGRYPLSPHRVVMVLGRLLHLWGGQDSVADAVVQQVRLPRVVAGILVGSALSCGGATYQAVLRNPLVSPDLLGVLSGSAFGAALMIVLGASPAWIQIGAFAGGVVAVGSGISISRLLPQGGLLTLLMGGLVANAVFTALLSLVKYTADPMDQLPAVVNWLLGTLSQTGWKELSWLTVPVLVLVAILVLLAPLLDVLSLGDDEARSLGVPIQIMRPFVILLATLACAMTISMAGIIGWVGLLVPHISRMLAGAEHRRMMPVCALLGAAGVLLADTVSRSLTSGEVPLGIMTELFGALAFILVLRRLRGDAA